MIDVKHQINAVDRTVGARTLAAGTARVITITQTYGAEVGDAWDACTNTERIPRWFLPVRGDLREGGHYQLEGNASGTISSCDPPHRFSATWEFGGDVSWIDVRLTEDADGHTILMLEHVAHVDDTRWSEFGPGAVGVGWDAALLGLAECVWGGNGWRSCGNRHPGISDYAQAPRRRSPTAQPSRRAGGAGAVGVGGAAARAVPQPAAVPAGGRAVSGAGDAAAVSRVASRGGAFAEQVEVAVVGGGPVGLLLGCASAGARPERGRARVRRPRRQNPPVPRACRTASPAATPPRARQA